MSHGITTAKVLTNQEPGAPRLRVNLTAPLPLTTSWQRLDFAGTSALNGNLFPNPVTGPGMDPTKPMAWWDTSNKLFRFQGIPNKTYDVLFNTKITSGSLIGAVLSLTGIVLAKAQMRFVIPYPAGVTNPLGASHPAGTGPFYFPLPDSDGCIDLVTVGLSATDRSPLVIPITATQGVIDYGLGIDVRIANAFLGGATATINAGDLVLYGR